MLESSAGHYFLFAFFNHIPWVSHGKDCLCRLLAYFTTTLDCMITGSQGHYAMHGRMLHSMPVLW